MNNNDLLPNSSIVSFNSFISSDIATQALTTISGTADFTTANGTSVKVVKKPNLPVQIFFGLMKKKMGMLKDYSYQKRIKRLEEAVDVAGKNGQIAFSEELIKKLFVLVKESEMYALGYRIFLDRDFYEKFKGKTKRPISLTAIKNYARPIPQNVMDKKKICDDNKLFDGYVVMHYDDGKTVKETEKEAKERREKDPILFGIVEHSSRLYFVDDWEDEYCDLTLDDIIDTLELEEKDTTLSKNIAL